MSDRNIERKYPRFFSTVVRVLLILMVVSFIFNAAEFALDRNKASAASAAAFTGGSIPDSLTGTVLMAAVRLLSGSLIITFTYLSSLFFREKEYVYSAVTAALVIIISISAVSSFF